jgi:hypothetical protein
MVVGCSQVMVFGVFMKESVVDDLFCCRCGDVDVDCGCSMW